jgi:protein-S-isoprenylcysteine O-methyltransferase Ste14
MASNTDDRATEIHVDLLLDGATREARLWDRARGRGRRWTYDDAGHLLAVVLFVALFVWSSARESVSPTVTVFVCAIAAVASWQHHRLSRRVDALVTLIEKAAAKRTQ